MPQRRGAFQLPLTLDAYYRRIVWGQFAPYSRQQVSLPLPLKTISPAEALLRRDNDRTYR